MYDIKGLLSSVGVKPSKRLSQNFLINDAVIEAEIGFANLSGTDTVLDIGAGFGFLTEKLSGNAKKTIAVELDKRLAVYLKTRFRGNRNIEVVQGDILELVKGLEFDKVVANIPYEISSPLTFAILEKGFKLAIICYQKEFADRMVAKPGTKDYSRLSVMTSYFADAKILMRVPKQSFYPQPKVDSAVVSMTLKKERPYTVKDEKFFFGVVASLFQHKKQTVRNALKHSLNRLMLTKEGFRKVGLPNGLESRRVFTLTGQEMAKVAEEVGRHARSD
ncbi:MAG: ribosomal RNA small subunit methyltransferase A [Candidatus Aenigmarchaeota archaeon]|nr:ribosomal RNA small subunit methyltransferase A [Candidatus Aenigmarchaeota archaeon]